VGGEPSVSPGQVTALDQSITVNDASNGDQGQLSELIQTDAGLQPGDSGGPMYDANGTVIGINTAADAGRFRQGSQESYAIPIDTAESIADQIRSGRAATPSRGGVKGFLGVRSRPARAVGRRDGCGRTRRLAPACSRVTSSPRSTARPSTPMTPRPGLHGHHPGDQVMT
jgi:S1-C subfamily serine protease